MKDRTPRYPGRVKMVPVPGQANTYDMVRADSPVEEGTPINKKTLLTDETAYILELKQENPTVDDALAHIGKNFTGDMGMNINLLEEAINMKYCKVLTKNETDTAESAFLTDAIWSLACKHPAQGWSVVAKVSNEEQKVIQFRSKTSNGTLLDFALNLPSEFFYTNANTTANSARLHETLCTVENRPYEVCLLVTGYTTTTYGSNTRYVSWRIWSVFDIRTGEKKASSVAYNSGASSSYYTYLEAVTKPSLWCYYNATYNYYYATFHRRHDTTSYGYVAGMAAGHDYSGVAYDTEICTFNTYHGTVNSDSYYAGCSAMMDDQNILYAVIRPGNVLYLYKYTLTSATAATNSTLASSTSITTFTTSSWGYRSEEKLHMLVTPGKQMYIYAVGYSNPAYIQRYGPFTLNTTSITEAAHFKRMLAVQSQYSYVFPVCNINYDPERLVYALYNYSDKPESAFMQVTNDTSVYRLLRTYRSYWYCYEDTVFLCSGDKMKSTFCADNSFSWVYLGYYSRIGTITEPMRVAIGETEYWTCPEDGRYKVIMVGGGAAGSDSRGGGSGHLKIFTRQYMAGDRVPYVIGGGQEYNGNTYAWMYKYKDRSTYFDDEIALCGVGQIGGANGYLSSDGGGGGGYNLVTFGGNGQSISNVPNLNGGQGKNNPATGYGAGGSALGSGRDGVIVIIR